jgi:hypothetical protein
MGNIRISSLECQVKVFDLMGVKPLKLRKFPEDFPGDLSKIAKCLNPKTCLGFLKESTFDTIELKKRV